MAPPMRPNNSRGGSVSRNRRVKGGCTFRCTGCLPTHPGWIRSKSGSVCCSANICSLITFPSRMHSKPLSESISPITIKRPSRSTGPTPLRSLNRKSVRIYDSVYLGCSIAILQDLQGPKIRTGTLQGGQPVLLADGAKVTITTRDVVGNAQIVSTTYKLLPQDVKAGDRILLDDGLLELRVLGSDGTDVQCLVVHGGILKEHKGINLPGVAVSAGALTEKDRDDLKFGVLHDVDYVALSFVRRPQDVLEAQEFIRQVHAEQIEQHTQGSIPVIAKLEKPEAVARLDEILEVVDGVMIARGDLGVEMAPEKVPLIQKRIIARCNDRGLPVITATQMLESMVTNPRPTRAEASDVANAI